MSIQSPSQRQLERQTIGVQFLQELFEQARLAVKVSPLDEKAYQSLMYDESQVLNWLNHYPLYCFKERAFHLGLQRVKSDAGEEVMIGIYDSRIGKLHILLLEPLSEPAGSELPERLMAIVTYVAIYFLTTYPDSIGVYLIDPPKPFLSNYGVYGYKILNSESEVPVMFANFEALFERQQDFLFEMLLDETLDLDLGLDTP
ncbi:hypothetical protein L1D24_07480 [Vibrio brasiliensis]|uniref:hypothetical protein n=1 Tax=Vibrio brasiliensis TaxID=170652 RepID=UPI001EFC9418|nr:hypothetical protein [Vibrio brasiliensis]MCG9648410.1 hypothetical protein [Vibrio brasiliensis]